MNFEQLKEPFLPTDLEWRIQQAGKTNDGRIWARVLAYITSRAVMDRLDAACGPENWRNEFRNWTVGNAHGVLCGISIRIGDEWVTKWDGADPTDIEAIKGGLSDASKRAAVQWGIGRYLYDLGENYAEIHDQKKPGANYARTNVARKGQPDDWQAFYWFPPQLPKFALPGQASAGASEAPRQEAEPQRELTLTSDESQEEVQRRPKKPKPDAHMPSTKPGDEMDPFAMFKSAILNSVDLAAADRALLEFKQRDDVTEARKEMARKFYETFCSGQKWVQPV